MRLLNEVWEACLGRGRHIVADATPCLAAAHPIVSADSFPRAEPASNAYAIVRAGRFGCDATDQLVLMGNVCRLGVLIKNRVSIGIQAGTSSQDRKLASFFVVDVEHDANAEGPAGALQELSHGHRIESVGAGVVQEQHGQCVVVQARHGFGKSSRNEVRLLFHGLIPRSVKVMVKGINPKLGIRKGNIEYAFYKRVPGTLLQDVVGASC